VQFCRWNELYRTSFIGTFAISDNGFVKLTPAKVMSLTCRSLSCRSKSPGMDFTNMFTRRFYMCRPQKCKETVKSSGPFCTFRICARKSCLKKLMKLTQGCQFHQHFTSSFCACRSQKCINILTTWLSSYALGSYGRKSFA